jgi:hypothetical protein
MRKETDTITVAKDDQIKRQFFVLLDISTFSPLSSTSTESPYHKARDGHEDLVTRPRK